MELRAHSAQASTTSLSSSSSSSYMDVVDRMSPKVSLKYPATTLSCKRTTQWIVDNFWTLSTNNLPGILRESTARKSPK
jgi:hypothetical protein